MGILRLLQRAQDPDVGPMFNGTTSGRFALVIRGNMHNPERAEPERERWVGDRRRRRQYPQARRRPSCAAAALRISQSLSELAMSIVPWGFASPGTGAGWLDVEDDGDAKDQLVDCHGTVVVAVAYASARRLSRRWGGGGRYRLWSTLGHGRCGRPCQCVAPIRCVDDDMAFVFGPKDPSIVETAGRQTKRNERDR